MTKLSDTQRILLSTAAQRDIGSLYPLPATIKPSGETMKAIAALASRGLAEERETTAADQTCRSDGEQRYSMFVTAAGLAAIGIEPPADAGVGEAAPLAIEPKRVKKTSAVLDLLRRPDGATLAELIAATGWLPHTTRAALTGLRKQGHAIVRGKRDDITCYTIAAA